MYVSAYRSFETSEIISIYNLDKTVETKVSEYPMNYCIVLYHIMYNIYTLTLNKFNLVYNIY